MSSALGAGYNRTFAECRDEMKAGSWPEEEEEDCVNRQHHRESKRNVRASLENEQVVIG